MRRIIITALIALTALGGVASADRNRGDRGDRYRDRGGVRVERHRQDHRQYQPRTMYRPGYRQNVRPSYRQNYRQNYRSNYRVVRQPIYVQRPVIRYRYYDYAQRPTVIVENYPAKAGYLWVPGQWAWSGYEWIWQPGHYQPDPAFDQQPYYGDTAGGYYDANGNWVDPSYYNNGY